MRGDSYCLSQNMFGFQQYLDCWPGFCCGTCGNRYCCYDYDMYLNQTSDCGNCNAYTDDDGNYNPSQSCAANGQFCCGDCSSRTCCGINLFALDQTTCTNDATTTTTTTTTTTSTTSTTYPISNSPSVSNSSMDNSTSENYDYYDQTNNGTDYWVPIPVIIISQDRSA